VIRPRSKQKHSRSSFRGQLADYSIRLKLVLPEIHSFEPQKPISASLKRMHRKKISKQHIAAYHPRRKDRAILAAKSRLSTFYGRKSLKNVSTAGQIFGEDKHSLKQLHV